MQTGIRTVLLGIALLALIVLYLFGICDLFSLVLSFLAIITFDLINRFFKLDFTIFHYLIFIWTISSFLVFGQFFFSVDYYDKILHLTIPFLFSFIIFRALGKTRLTYGWRIFATFLVMVAFINFWEIYEYIGDITMNVHLQGVYLNGVEVVSRIDDTMLDLIMGTISSMLFAIFKLIQ